MLLGHVFGSNLKLREFLPAGTITLRIISGSLNLIDDSLPPYSELSGLLVDAADDFFLKSLYFLIVNEFIAVQCAFRRGVPYAALVVRVYLIPYDLPNVRGRLRLREQKILRPARRYMRMLLARVSRGLNNWEDAQPADPSCVTEQFLPPETDDRTMAELYSALNSPNPASSPVDLDALTTNARLGGMRSALYPYQRRSVQAMLCKEMEPSTILDPLYVPVFGIDGSCYYLQPSTMEILTDLPMVNPSKGGILCEELGTGKTVMILALILATLDQLPAPEESLLSEPSVLTPLSLQAFSRPEDVHARQLGKHREPSSPRIPSLRELMVHYCRVNPEGIGLRQYHDRFADRRLLEAIEKNVPFYLQSDEDPVFHTDRSRRRRSAPKPRITFLTSATLVVVPPNLLNQWTNEIHKHCEDTLRVLVIRDNTPLPSAMVLASFYDIILMSHLRFSTEASKNKLTQLHIWKACNCSPVDSQLRVPDCRCQNYSDVSPLLQIRWKRLVVDEGHVSANFIGNLTTFAKRLSVERRWLVTGTPTTNLMGLTFGDGSELLYPEDDPELPSELLQLLSTAPSDSSSEPDLDDSGTPSEPSSCRIWTPQDRNDLTKLANMITHFLKTAPFASMPKLFSTHVIASLMDPAGPRPGSIQVLRQVMDMVMIRHRSEDVEQDVLLPLLNQETILLDLEPYAVKTYNILQAGIVINAVDSERVDQDYFFHPRNHTHLLQIIENISQAMFWHTDEALFNIHEQFERHDDFRKKAVESPTVSADDCILLDEALGHVKDAVNDHVWQALCQHVNVFHEVTGLPDDVYQAWSVLPSTVAALPNFPNPHITLTYLCSPERLSKLRDMLFRSPLSQIPRMIEWGHAVSQEEELRVKFNISRLHVSKVVKRQKEHLKGNTLALLKEMDVRNPEKLKEVHRELVLAQDRVKALSDQQAMGSREEANSSRFALLASSPLAGVHIRNSMSSKLNYILKEIKLHAHTDKFLIFSRSPLTLAYIAESLDLLQVKCLQFTSKIPLREREQYVTTFETSDMYRIFLMELKHGARGLNLITACRVIFCKPVWQADVETQAIKRVHRIGQTSPVTVKTLAIRSTFEEFMLSHREKGKGSTRSQKSGIFAEDRTMRDFIANPSFLPVPSPGSHSSNLTLDFPYLGKFKRSVSDMGVAGSAQDDRSASDQTQKHVPTAKKPRLVQFAR